MSKNCLKGQSDDCRVKTKTLRTNSYFVSIYQAKSKGKAVFQHMVLLPRGIVLLCVQAQPRGQRSQSRARRVFK